MFGRQNPKGSRPPGSLDFEFTDLSDARRTLDELPPGVREFQQLDPGYWAQRRRKPVATDRALTGVAMAWVMALPAPARPHGLCEKYPRIVNVIAEAWPDAVAAERALQALLVDQRGHRQGFPSDIEDEIRLLAAYRAKLAR